MKSVHRAFARRSQEQPCCGPCERFGAKSVSTVLGAATWQYAVGPRLLFSECKEYAASTPVRFNGLRDCG